MMTTTAGASIADNQNAVTAGPLGPSEAWDALGLRYEQTDYVPVFRPPSFVVSATQDFC
jgi:hypothetical protein